MKHLSFDNTKYYDVALSFHHDLLNDIKDARSSIFLETFKFGGEISYKIRDLLVEKAKLGVKIKLLIDHWGSMVSDSFFRELEDLGAEVRFFRVFKFTFNFISYNNRRDHRKIVIIDNKITYVGSANINNHSINWREFVVRINDSLFANKMIMVFLDNFKIHNLFFHSKKKHLKPIRFASLEIIRDVPSLRFQKIRNKFLYFIRRAKKSIVIETPYFVPDFKILWALIQAAKRGVDIKLIIPKNSDMKIVDIFTQSFFGKLHKRGIKILFFNKGFTHAKVGLFDDEVFYFGSSNFDYRSFGYQYEVGFFGKNFVLKEYVGEHIKSSLSHTEEFDYNVWKMRPLYKRIFEVLLEPFKHFF